MNAHDERHEIAIAELLADDGPAARDARRARAAECGECAEQLEELGSITAVLDDMKHEQDEILALAAHAPKSTRADVLAAAVRAGVRLSTPASPRRLPAFVGFALAIAAMIAIAFMLGRRDTNQTFPAEPTTETSTYLGDEKVIGVDPIGPVAAIDAFTWNGTLASGETFALFVRDLAGTDPARLIKDEIRTSSYSLTPEEKVGIPRDLEWSVVVYGPSGETIATSKAVRTTRTGD